MTVERPSNGCGKGKAYEYTAQEGKKGLRFSSEALREGRSGPPSSYETAQALPAIFRFG